MSRSDAQPRYGVVLFRSVHAALAAEKRLQAEGIEYKLIAVPSHLSSNCGFCIRFAWADKSRLEQLLQDPTLSVERIVPLDGYG